MQEVRPAPPDHPVLTALAELDLPASGALLDVGGAAGHVAAGFRRDHPEWSARVVEPSEKAIETGRSAFPGIDFRRGTITGALPDAPGTEGYDLVIVSGVFAWVDRSLLARAVAETDAVLRDGGHLALADFDPPYPRANPYKHRPGLYTYKQDYASCYLALGTYHLERRRSTLTDTGADPGDPYDRRWMTAILRKDLQGRYARPE